MYGNTHTVYASTGYPNGMQGYPSPMASYPQPVQSTQFSSTVVLPPPVMHFQTAQSFSSPMPQQQVMMTPMMPQQQTVYLAAPSPTMSSGPMMGMMPDSSCPCRCPNCGRQIVTRVNNKVGSRTWLWALAILILLPGFCCIPFLVPSCLDQEHFCPQCNTLVGTRSR